MNNFSNVAAFGSDIHSKLSRFEDKSTRASLWNSLLKDNEKGVVVNADGGALHYEDHKKMLDDVVAARKYMPTVFDTLSSIAGVVVPVSLNQTLVGMMNKNEFDAKTSMNGSGRTNNQSNYKYSWVPQPIYHTDFSIPFRQNGFSYKNSDGVSESVSAVALERDSTLVLGNSDIVVDVNGTEAELYGLTNHPDTLAMPSGISDWADSANNDKIYKETITLVKEMFTKRKAAQIPNSIIMFVANDVMPEFDADYSDAKGDRTVKERVMAITAIKEVMPCQWLPDGAVLLVEASPQTLRIPTSNDVIVTPWNRVDPFEDLRFTVFAASTLQVRSDRNGNTGLLYATK